MIAAPNLRPSGSKRAKFWTAGKSASSSRISHIRRSGEGGSAKIALAAHSSQQASKRLGGFEIILLARHEYPRARASVTVERTDRTAESERRAAGPVTAQELDEVGGLGQHEDDAAGRALGPFGKGPRTRRIAEPALQLLGVLGLQRVEQCLQAAPPLGPQGTKHVGDKDAAGFQPHVVIATARLRNQLMCDSVGIGGMSDLVERRPIRATCIERN